MIPANQSPIQASSFCRRAKIAVVLAAANVCTSAIAFELATHAAITSEAWARTVTESSRLLDRLGFQVPSTGKLPNLGERYRDVRGESEVGRNLYGFERKLIERESPFGLSLPDQATRINGWLMMGAIREDDNPSDGNPKDDPYQGGGAFHRELNHFFDPVYRRPLEYPGLGILYGSQPIRKAYDWALGTENALADDGARDRASTWNHFTVFDAREAMFRALTLLKRDDSGTYVELAIDDDAAAREATRKAYWATTFRALGDIVHLNQDMAQPQHTRNEIHASRWYLSAVGISESSAFELYVDERVRQVEKIDPLKRKFTPPPLSYVGYPTPVFDRYVDFWTTVGSPDSIPFGRGLADYSNHGFFTVGNNYGDKEYPDPPSIDYPRESAIGVMTTRPDVTTQFLRGDVADRLVNTSTNIRLATESIWNGYSGLSGKPITLYTLTRPNYFDMASLLIPRAVGYSAGILQYFFRGEMEIGVPEAGFYGIVDHSKFAPSRAGAPTDVRGGFKGFDRIRVTLKNTTPQIVKADGSTSEQPMPKGSLMAVARFHRNLCYDDLLADWPLSSTDARACRSPTEEIVTSEIFEDQEVPASGATSTAKEWTFMFTRREVPINAWDVVLQVVYRGELGFEKDAVVVATKNISEPVFMGFANATDYVIVGGRFYKPDELATRQELFANVFPSCREGTVGTYRVRPACYNFADDFSFVAGVSATTIASDSAASIRSRKFARIAMLVDHDTYAALNWNPDAVTCWVFLSNPLSVRPYSAEQDADGRFDYRSPATFRSLRLAQTNACVVDISYPQTSVDALDFAQLDDLKGAELEPIPLKITGW